MAVILLVNGPNLNTLGQREPEIYGEESLTDIENRVRQAVEGSGHTLLCFQSNSEGGLIDWLQENRGGDFLVINPGAFTHTSIALRDCLSGLAIPFVEIHISNIHKREPFRRHSYLSSIAEGVIAGVGTLGYDLAARAATEWVAKNISKA